MDREMKKKIKNVMNTVGTKASPSPSPSPSASACDNCSGVVGADVQTAS